MAEYDKKELVGKSDDLKEGGISIKSELGFNITKAFSVGGSTTFRQNDSTQVTNGVTLRRTTTHTTMTPPGGTVGKTVIIGLERPKIKFVGNSSRARMEFLSATKQFGITVEDLQSDPNAIGLFKPATRESFLAQYVPLTDPTGSTLVRPRFKLRLNVTLSAGVVDTYTFSKATGSVHSENKTSVTSVEIVEKSGFSIPGVFSAAFEVGETIEVTATAVQEFTTDKMISVSTTLNRTTLGVNQVYWDRVWKTFVIIDKGAPGTSQPTVQGTIVDVNGHPISGAYVRLVQDNAEYAARTNSSGQYTISTPQGEPLSSGTYPIICGDATQYVSIGSGPSYMSFYGADPFSSRDTEFSGETMNLN